METVNNLVTGILLGGLYAVAAIGLSIVFGTMKLVNLAHGQLLILGAYLTTMLITLFAGGDPLLLGIPAAIILAVLVYPLQRYIITPVMSQGEEPPMTVTFGISVVITTLLVIFFTSKPMAIWPVEYATTQFDIGGVKIRLIYLIATGLAVVFILALMWILKKTAFGRQVRAASIDAEAAGLVGIDVKKTYARVMALAAFIAGYAGVVIALSGAVAPTSGTSWLLRAFTVVVIGGLASLPGTLYGGFIVGIVETFGAVYIGPQYRDLLVFGLLVVILLVRPNGLFAKAAKA
jgi:branched-chain amino acid transport system permease protein